MDLKLGATDHQGSYWAVMADIAIAMFIVLILYIIAQYVRDFERISISEKLEKRQEEVKELILSELSEEFKGGVIIESLSPETQKLTFNADVLFAVCRDDLKFRGEQMLLNVGNSLELVQHYLNAIQVDGHTDVVPIGKRGNCPYESNWELSSSRATTVVRLFAGRCQINPERLSAVGWAEYHPVDKSSLDPNRRIEVTLRYDRDSIKKALYAVAIGSR